MELALAAIIVAVVAGSAQVVSAQPMQWETYTIPATGTSVRHSFLDLHRTTGPPRKVMDSDFRAPISGLN